MTRSDLLKIVIGRARHNGFEFRRWYTARLGLPWISAAASLAILESQRRYYVLLFSHEFAYAFWKPGEEISFRVPSQTFQRRMADGSIATVTRKPFTRRSARKDAWRYHLRQMALATDPLRYIRKYLNIEDENPEELEAELNAGPILPKATAHHPAARPAAKPKKHSKPGHSKQEARPLPTGLPAFLKRPYHPRNVPPTTPNN